MEERVTESKKNFWKVHSGGSIALSDERFPKASEDPIAKKRKACRPVVFINMQANYPRVEEGADDKRDTALAGRL